MAGYGEVFSTILNNEMQKRRLQEAQRQHDMEQQRHLQTLQRQYQLMQQQGQMQEQRLQFGLDAAARAEQARQREHVARERARGEQHELGLKRLEQQGDQARRAAEQRDRPPLKLGYMRNPQNPAEQTPVPGGPAWRDLSSKHGGDLASIGIVDEASTEAAAKIDRILDPKKKGSFNSNFGGYNALATQYLPGETQDVRNDLETLKASLKTFGLSLIRSSSGAVGSITEREWPILEKQIESLSPLMSEGAAEDALKRIKARMEQMRGRALEVYKAEWGDSPFYKADPLTRSSQQGPEGTATVPKGVDPKVWRFMTPAEKKLWQTQR